MNDLISRAVTLFRKGDDNRFAYAELAAQIVGKRDGGTEELARQLRYKDVSTIEGHAKAGRLVTEMLTKMPKRGEIFRDSLYFSFWVEAGKVFYRKDSEFTHKDVAEWFDKAISERQTIEVFRASLPRVHAEPSYFDTVKKYYSKLDFDLINAPFTGCDEEKAVKVREAALILKDAMSELLDSEMSLKEAA